MESTPFNFMKQPVAANRVGTQIRTFSSAKFNDVFVDGHSTKYFFNINLQYMFKATDLGNEKKKKIETSVFELGNSCG